MASQVTTRREGPKRGALNRITNFTAKNMCNYFLHFLCKSQFLHKNSCGKQNMCRLSFFLI
jgi:hypothetical protein